MERLKEMEESRASLERERLRRQALRDEHAERALFVSRSEARLRALSAAEEEGRAELARLREERERLEGGTGEPELAHWEERHRTLAEAHAAAYRPARRTRPCCSSCGASGRGRMRSSTC